MSDSAEESNSPARRVEIWPEYRIGLPISGPKDLIAALPASLLDRLATWQRFFDDHFDPHAHWKSNDEAQWWKTEAEDLTFLLKRHLPSDVELDVDLWPLEVDEA